MSAILETMELLRELRDRKDSKSILTWGEHGPYPTQWAAVNSDKDVVGLFGGNQTGKSITGLRKIAYQATGVYPEDFYGRKRTQPGFFWIVGESSDLTRDSLQKKMFGPDPNYPGRGGIIPHSLIVGKPVIRQNSGGAYDQVRIRFADGGVSTIGFKNYSQGRENLQSATLDGLMVDEEPPLDCWTELMFRVSEAKKQGWGQTLFTFTPLRGSTKLVRTLVESQDDPNSDITIFFLTAEEANHLGQGHIAFWTKMLRHDPAQLKARLYGLPDINMGLIWHADWAAFKIPRFKIPDKWPRLGAMDYGWNHPTTNLIGAVDPQTDDCFVYHGQDWDHKTYYEVAKAMRPYTNKGIQFYGDPSSEQPDKSSGKPLIHSYLDELQPGWENIPPEERCLVHAPRTPKVRNDMVQERLDNGTLFFFDDLPDLFFNQVQDYSWTKKGKLPEIDDDYPDTLGYLVQCLSKARRMQGMNRPWARRDVPMFKTPMRGY